MLNFSAIFANYLISTLIISAALMAQMNRSFTKAGVWITSARLALGLTMEQFAAECDVSVISVSSWERGVRMPKVEKLIRFAKAHDLPIDPLI